MNAIVDYLARVPDGVFWLFGKIPDVVWAAVIASSLTFGGVYLTNRNSRKQHQATLDNDARQKILEREMSMKREIYVPAADAISRLQNLLSRIPDVTHADKDLSTEFTQCSSALAKIHIVGTNSTVQAVSAYQIAYGAAYATLILKRIVLFRRHLAIKSAGQTIDKALEEQTRWVKVMQELNLRGSVERHAWDAANGNMDIETKRVNDEMAARKLLTEAQRQEVMEVFRVAADHVQELSRHIPSILFAVRDELKMPLDKAAYLQLQEDGLTKGKKILENFLADASTFQAGH